MNTIRNTHEQASELARSLTSEEKQAYVTNTSEGEQVGSKIRSAILRDENNLRWQVEADTVNSDRSLKDKRLGRSLVDASDVMVNEAFVDNAHWDVQHGNSAPHIHIVKGSEPTKQK